MAGSSERLKFAEGGHPSDSEVRAALERLISHEDFGASERRAAFLRFVVEETLSGRANELKGFTIANAVFGRDETFDSKTDPVVRLEARRLRHDLDSYYVDAGAEDPIRISIPKGGYVPRFTLTQQPPPGNANASDPALFGLTPVQTGTTPAPHTPRAWIRPRLLAMIAAPLAAGAVLAAVVLTKPAPAPSDPSLLRGYPRIAVMAFDAIDSSEEARLLSAGLPMELVHALRRFEDLRIYQPLEGIDRRALVEDMRREPGAAYIVGGAISTDRTRLRVDTNLRDLRTDEVIWSESYDTPLEPDAFAELRDTVARLIATAIGQPYGPISHHLVQHGATVDEASLESYMCVLRAYEHRRAFSHDTYGPTLACLENAVTRDPNYSDAWAMLGWLHLDAGRYDYPGAAAPEKQYDLAINAAQQALALAPDSALALKALSSIEHYRAHYEESERLARRAVALNPYDPDAKAQLGWRLAVRGRFDEGVPLLHEAIERSVNPPGWYFHLLAIDHLMKGDFAAMRREADRAALTSRPISNLLLAIAAGGTGDRETAHAALSRIPESWDAEAYLRLHGATNEIVATMTEGLETARQLAGVVKQQ